jgi:hypothetical protein
VLNIDQEHPEYREKQATRNKYRDLYAGGERIKLNAGQYLVRRQKEPMQVYAERLNCVFYENYIGSIIDWYTSTLFRREPVLIFGGPDENGRTFFRAFSDDCDRKGTSVTDFFRRQLCDALVDGHSHILIDFPRSLEPAANRAEEDAKGLSRAYMVGYSAENLINWSLDDEGNYAWVVLRTSRLCKEKLADAYVKETRWTYYDKQEFHAFRRVDAEGVKGKIEEIDHGHHSLWKQQRVPLLDLEISDGLWLMNKAALLQLEHFNKSNALSWALSMGLFASPVIYSEREFDQVVGESYYIQLGPNDRFGYTEPTGHVYTIAAENLLQLKDEIYRVCYLLAQAGNSSGAGTQQSALSKQRDFTITQHILRAYGDAVKDAIKRALCAVAAAREDELTIDVSGLDEFDIGDFSDELDDAAKLFALGIQSQAFRKQVYKKLAFKYLCDVRQALKDEIATEIDQWFEQQQGK